MSVLFLGKEGQNMLHVQTEAMQFVLLFGAQENIN
jgi:hypothetical protein